MSIYPLSPSPNFQGETLYQTWEDGFTPNECHRIINYGESLSPKPATVGNNIDTNVVNSIRTSKTAWLECNNDTNRRDWSSFQVQHHGWHANPST